MAKAKVLTPSQVKLLIETYTSNKDINATAKTVGLSKSVCITRLKNEDVITIDEANALRGTVKKSNKNSQTDKKTTTTKAAKTSTAKSKTTKTAKPSAKTVKPKSTKTKVAVNNTEAKPPCNVRVSTKATTKAKPSKSVSVKAKTTASKRPKTDNPLKTKANTKSKPAKAKTVKPSKTTTKAKTNTKGKKQVQKTQEELDLEREIFLNKKYGVGKWRILTRDEFVQRCTDLLLDMDDNY